MVRPMERIDFIESTGVRGLAECWRRLSVHGFSVCPRSRLFREGIDVVTSVHGDNGTPPDIT